MKRRPLLLALALAAGCSNEPAPAPLPQTRDVVDPAIAGLVAELGELLAPLPAADERTQRAVDGLVPFAASARGADRERAVTDLANLGTSAIPALEAVARDRDAPATRREVALEALWTLAANELGDAVGPPDAPTLLDPATRPAPNRSLLAATAAIERSIAGEREAWLRARGAWYLGRLGLDRSIPALVLRLKYETDHEAVTWLAFALARFANYSGLVGLRNVAELSAGTPIGERAAQLGAAVAEQAGLPSAAAVQWAWDHGDPERVLPHPPRSAHHDLVLWQWIHRFDEFQLRGVDDARFMFERLDEHAARILEAALSDESRYVRLHVAQCLARLGRRATEAGPTLLEMLALPSLAPHAAEALGEIGFPEARGALASRLGGEHPLEVRIAAARALGRIGQGEARPNLAGLFDSRPASAELRQALAESLAYLRDAERAVPELIEAVRNPLLEPSTSRAALRFLVEQAALSGIGGADEVLAGFDPDDDRQLPAELATLLLGG